MSINDPIASLAYCIEKGVDNILKDRHTAMPGIIKSFDSVNQLATVQPAIKRIFKTQDGDVEITTAQAIPPLINVPVMFPRGGGVSITFPIAVDDECLLIFCERAIDAWHEKGSVQEANAKRFHSLSDAVCIPGLSSKPNSIPSFNATNFEIKSDDGNLKIQLNSAGNNIEISATNNVVINANELTVNADLDVQGDTSLTSVVTSDGVNIGSTHTHSGVTAGTDPSGPPIP